MWGRYTSENIHTVDNKAWSTRKGEIKIFKNNCPSYSSTKLLKTLELPLFLIYLSVWFVLFSGMGELFASPNLAAIAEGPLLVSSVQHKSSMEITEEGAEAAAATSLVISRSNPSFSLNQPFFFALMDDKTQAPVFLGVITNPNPGAPAMQSSGGSANLDKVHYPIDDKNGKNDKHYSHSFGGPPK